MWLPLLVSSIIRFFNIFSSALQPGYLIQFRIFPCKLPEITLWNPCLLDLWLTNETQRQYSEWEPGWLGEGGDRWKCLWKNSINQISGCDPTASSEAFCSWSWSCMLPVALPRKEKQNQQNHNCKRARKSPRNLTFSLNKGGEPLC